MIRLEDITTALALTGLEPASIGSVVAVVPIGEGAVQIIYKIPDGTLKDRLLTTKPQVLRFAWLYLMSCIDMPVSIVFPMSSGYNHETSTNLSEVWRYVMDYDLIRRPYKHLIHSFSILLDFSSTFFNRKCLGEFPLIILSRY